MRRIGPRAAYDKPRKPKRVPGINKEDLKRANVVKADFPYRTSGGISVWHGHPEVNA